MATDRALSVQARPTPPVVEPSQKPGFVDGVRFFFQGFSLLGWAPGALPLALVPIGAALVLTSALVTLTVWFVPGWVDAWIGATGWWVSIVQVLATAAFGILSVLVALALAQPASGPALEGIVRRVERLMGAAPAPESSFVMEVVRSAGSATIGLLGAGVSFVVLFLIGLIPGAAIVTVPLQFVAMSFALGWDVCDYPLSVQGLPLTERVRVVFGHARAVLGFSLGIAVCSLLPCGILLVLPVGVAGATRLVRAMRDERKMLLP